MRLKSLPAELAVFGGAPAFPQELPVGQLNVPDWDVFTDMFSDILERGYYTNNGPLVRQLEFELQRILNVRHAICVTNCTIALMIAARALDLRGEVIVPAFTFPGTVQALAWAGAIPVFADVDPRTHALTSDTVHPCLSDRTTAVLGVHLWGRACDPDRLGALCDSHGLKLFYDAAHAFACTHRGRPIGSLGAFEAFSFHATKIVSGAEGGCLTTNDDELANRARTLRNFHSSQTFAKVGPRINGKMSEAQAGMALLSLRNLDANIAHNRDIDAIYRARSIDWPGLRLYRHAPEEQNNYQYAVIEVLPGCRIDRDSLVELLRAENVLARRYFYPGLHRVVPFSEQYLHVSLPVTDALAKSCLQIPLGPLVDEDAASQISDLIAFACAHGDAILERMRA